MQEMAAAQVEGLDRGRVEGIQLQVYLKNRMEGEANEVELDLLYRSRPREVLELILDDPQRGVALRQGFDGDSYWLQEEGEELLRLDGHEYGRDREGIDDALDLCADLMLLLDLARLEDFCTPSSVLQHEDGRRILRGDLRRQDGSRWQFRLWLPADGLLPQRLDIGRRRPAVDTRAEPIVPDEEAGSEAPTPKWDVQHFHLLGYHAFEGRSIPRLIEIHQGHESAMPEVPSRIVQIHGFRWLGSRDQTSAPTPAE